LTFATRTRAGLVLLCAAWILPGLIGHVPWKGADGDTFAALIWAQHSHDWLVPTVAGSIDLSDGPLYTWLAGMLSAVFSAALPAYDAARLTTGFSVALAAWLLGLTARRLYSEEAGWAAALMLLGSVGLLLPGHSMNSHVIALAGTSALLFGLADLPTSPRRGGSITGLGLAAMGLSTGWLEPIALLPLITLLPAAIADYRAPVARRSIPYLLVFGLFPLVWWLGVLYVQSGHLLDAWWKETSQHLVFASSEQDAYHPGYISRNLLWFAWPAWPVAIWAVYLARKRLWTQSTLMPVLVALLPFVALSLTVHPDAVSMMPLLPPIALLGGAGLLGLRRGAANALLWFAVAVFSSLALLFWTYFTAWQFGNPGVFARKLAKLGVARPEEIHYWKITFGVLITLAWFALTPKIKRSAIRPILIWVLGMSFVWLLLAGLLISVVDRQLGYAVMASQVKNETGATSCVTTRGVPPTQRALLSYHSGIDFGPLKTSCEWLMIYNKRHREMPPGTEWVKRWDGARQGDRNEHFWLYQKGGGKKSA
jgi:4-amino-4-deoxy-L-arabinose transferase-like glycosyltransferase